MKLYELSAAIKAVFRKVEEGEGELTPDLEKELDDLNMKLSAKLVGCWKAIKAFDAEAKMLKEEEKNLQVRRKIAERKAEMAQAYVARNLTEGEPWSSGIAAFGWRKSSSVKVADVEKLPDFYIKTTKEPRKNEIKAALQNGETLTGCSIEEKQNLQVL